MNPARFGGIPPRDYSQPTVQQRESATCDEFLEEVRPIFHDLRNTLVANSVSGHIALPDGKYKITIEIINEH